MKHNIAGVAPDLLAPAYLDRFVALFGVAARKSLIEWKRASTGDAQLALLDASSHGEVVPASTPCVIYIGQSASVAEKSRAGRWVSHLPAEFTVSDLIDALDRAAVFLMDWTARQKMAAAKVSAVVDAAAQAAAAHAVEDDADDQYQLTSWVSLDAPYNTGACVRAMALLTRAPINLRQLCGHSGLDPETARADHQSQPPWCAQPHPYGTQGCGGADHQCRSGTSQSRSSGAHGSDPAPDALGASRRP